MTSEMTDIIMTDTESMDMRLDAFLASVYEDKSRTFFQKLIKEGSVLVDGKTVKPGLMLDPDQTIEISFPEPESLNILPEDIPLDIVYEDEDVILINKPRGMVVHPAAGHYSGTLVNALLYHCHDLSGINGVLRPGIVHRIDKDTTGIVIACKNDMAHRSIAAQLKAHTSKRAYYALVRGNIKEDSGTVDKPIGRDPKNRKKMACRPDGKNAVTHFTVLERFGNYTLTECRLETGRTHQIRVHMTSLGHPLAGDEVYGTGKDPFSVQGQLLHAYLFGFKHPSTHAYMEFTVPLPDDFEKCLTFLRNH